MIRLTAVCTVRLLWSRSSIYFDNVLRQCAYQLDGLLHPDPSRDRPVERNSALLVRECPFPAQPPDPSRPHLLLRKCFHLLGICARAHCTPRRWICSEVMIVFFILRTLSIASKSLASPRMPIWMMFLTFGSLAARFTQEA
jgi:hypothetical protein